MRKKIVAGNWKMNKTLEEATQLLSTLAQDCPENHDVTKIVIPPFLFALGAKEILESRDDFFVGVQNCHAKDSGAFTGEISAQAIQSIGATYCLVGHSERRTYFQESNEMLKEKIEACFRNQIIPIFCFGESLEARKSGKHFDIVSEQLKEVLKDFNRHLLGDIVYAYEPVWAIGTGETASPEQAQEMHAYIRTVLASLSDEDTAQQVSLLYGGSCNAQNAAELFSCPDVDGGLIGGASLKATDFISIISSFS